MFCLVASKITQIAINSTINSILKVESTLDPYVIAFPTVPVAKAIVEFVMDSNINL